MIEIFAVSYNSQPAAASVRGAFGPEGGTLGRGPDNRLPLPDPARHVSRLQAKVRYDGMRFWIANASEANPLFLNDEEIESGRERPIVPGDELRVGLYVLRVRTPVGPSVDYRPAGGAAEQTLGAGTSARPAAPPVGAGAGALDGLLGAADSASNPFADLLGGSTPLSGSGGGIGDAFGASPAAARPAAPALPMDPLQGLAAPRPAPGAPPVDPLADFSPSRPSPAPGAPMYSTPMPSNAPSAAPAGQPPLSAAPPSDLFAGLSGGSNPPVRSAPGPASAGDPLAAFDPASSNPFADLLGPSAAPAGPPKAARPNAPATHIPDDFNPFAMPAAPQRNAADPLRDLARDGVDLESLGGEKRVSLVDFDPSAKVDPRDALRGGTPSLMDPLQDADPMKLFGGPEDRLVGGRGGPAAGATPMRDDHAELGAHFTPPRALSDERLPAAQAPVPKPAPSPAATAPAAAATPSAAPPRTRMPHAASSPGAWIPETPAPAPMPSAAAAATILTSAPQAGAPVQRAPSAPGGSAAPAPRAASLPDALPRAVPLPDPPQRAAPLPDPPQRPPAAAPSPAGPRAVPAGPAAAPVASAELLAAFLEGANATTLNVPNGLTPDMMRVLGRLVYHAVAGAMTLISARQITKREMGAEVTMIVPRGNNPLKFLPTPEAALMQILGPKMPGFMSSVEAMQDAFEDLRAHEVGVIAGTRAALSEVLRRFDPKVLETRLGAGGMFDSMLPGGRRAKLWAAFETQFNEVYQEAEDDFNKLFGQAFITAYEAEVARHRGPR